jgi:hypothetical protein
VKFQPSNGLIARTTNPIESSFATIRIRTKKNKRLCNTENNSDNAFQVWDRSRKKIDEIKRP